MDLAEEHSTATLATERLELETTERLRLEKELQDIQVCLLICFVSFRSECFATVKKMYYFM